MPTMQVWKEWSSRPRDSRGIGVRLAEAINRWAHDKHSSAITFYESYNMAHRGDALEATVLSERTSGLSAQQKLNASWAFRTIGPSSNPQKPTPERVTTV